MVEINSNNCNLFIFSGIILYKYFYIFYIIFIEFYFFLFLRPEERVQTYRAPFLPTFAEKTAGVLAAAGCCWRSWWSRWRLLLLRLRLRGRGGSAAPALAPLRRTPPACCFFTALLLWLNFLSRPSIGAAAVTWRMPGQTEGQTEWKPMKKSFFFRFPFSFSRLEAI